MLTYEQITDQARAYANFTDEQLCDMETGTLHEHLSLRLVAVEELKASKRAIVSSTNELLKRVNGDALAINHQIRRRNALAEEERRATREELTLEVLPAPAELVHVC
jgi:hypothetical protein